MSGYRGDGYGVYGDHGDDDYYQGRLEDRGDRNRGSRGDDEQMRGRGDGGRVEYGYPDDRSRRGVRLEEEDRDRLRGRSAYQDQPRGRSFLERSGHAVHDYRSDDDDRGGRSPLGLGDRSRQGGGLGVGRGEQRFPGSGPHDHYLSWRERHLAELDRDYEDYCQEHGRRFSDEFQNWRENRRTALESGPSTAAIGAGVSSDGAGGGRQSEVEQNSSGGTGLDNGSARPKR